MAADRSRETEWIPCPDGTIAEFAGRARLMARRRTITRVTGASAIVALFAVTGFLVFGPKLPIEHTYGGITCSDVRSNAAAYFAETLTADVSEQIRIHLDRCGECNQFVHTMMPTPVAQTDHRRQTDVHLTSGCQHCRSKSRARESRQAAHRSLAVLAGL
jgi:hypothetical protein